jgi:hypothetical protein
MQNILVLGIVFWKPGVLNLMGNSSVIELMNTDLYLKLKAENEFIGYDS